MKQQAPDTIEVSTMRTRHSRNDGYVVITVALLLAVLLGFAALAVDVGLMYSARSAAQRAADSAALAGAYSFVTSYGPQPDTAETHARNTALTNTIMADPIVAGDVSVNVDVPNRRVTVGITQPRGTYFGRALGWDSATIAVQAVAEASPFALGASCVKPWFLPNTIFSTTGVCGEAGACATGQVIIKSDGSINQALLDERAGTAFILKPSNPQNALSPGQFYCMRIGDSTGGNDYRTNIGTCSPQAIQCQKVYPVEPGNMIGPTAQGVRDLIGDSPDTWIARGVYGHADGSPNSNTSRSLVVAPIWDICALSILCDESGDFRLPDHGANVQIPVVGFALLFIDGVVNGNDVQAHVVSIFTCGDEPPAENPEVTGPFSIPVRLVRVPQAEAED